jgi:chromosome segregation ATPase
MVSAKEDIAIDELELQLMSQKTMLKSIQVEIKRLEIKKSTYLESISGLEEKIKEGEKRLAELKERQSEPAPEQ